MGWTNPKTWAVGEILTSPDLNTYVGDNTSDLDRRTTMAAANVGTSETTTSTTYVDLATPGPTTTITAGTSGLCLLILSCNLSNNTAGAVIAMSYTISGATSAAASDDHSILIATSTAGLGIQQAHSIVIPITGLAAGANTFTAKYRVSAGTGTFADRRIIAIPLGS